MHSSNEVNTIPLTLLSVWKRSALLANCLPRMHPRQSSHTTASNQDPRHCSSILDESRVVLPADTFLGLDQRLVVGMISNLAVVLAASTHLAQREVAQHLLTREPGHAGR